MNKIKVGIIGLGSVALNIHIPNLSTFEDVKIEAATEVNIDRGKRITKKWNIPNVYQDHNDMLHNSSLDAVFVCVPHILHHTIVKDALLNNVHVFCEKPFGLNSNDANKLLYEAKKRDLILTVGYNRRFEKNFNKARSIVKSMRLGKITHVQGVFVCPGPYRGYHPSSDWFFREESGGALCDNGCHLIDLITYILSDHIEEVSADSSNTLKLNIFDNIAGVFSTKKGSLGTFNIGWQSAINSLLITFHGTGGSIFVDTDEVLEIHGRHGPLEKILNNLISVKGIIGKFLNGSKGFSARVKLDRAFIDSIVNNEESPVPGEEAVHVLEVLEAINESLETKKSVRVYRRAQAS